MALIFLIYLENNWISGGHFLCGIVADDSLLPLAFLLWRLYWGGSKTPLRDRGIPTGPPSRLSPAQKIITVSHPCHRMQHSHSSNHGIVQQGTFSSFFTTSMLIYKTGALSYCSYGGRYGFLSWTRGVLLMSTSRYFSLYWSMVARIFLGRSISSVWLQNIARKNSHQNCLKNCQTRQVFIVSIVEIIRHQLLV